MEPLVIPLRHFSLPPDPWIRLQAEAEANTQRSGHLPGMIIGHTGSERLAVVRSDLSPGQLAAIEIELLGRPGVEWTVFCGEAVMTWGAGLVRHIFLRRRDDAGHWRAALRPIAGLSKEIAWLDDWREIGGDSLIDGPLFPLADAIEVRFEIPS